MKKFKVYDYFENYGCVRNYDTLKDAKKACKEWHEDTDGDCDLVIKVYDEKFKVYVNTDYTY